MANFEFKESFDNFLKLRKALKFLKNNPVYVGIPEDTILSQILFSIPTFFVIPLILAFIKSRTSSPVISS